MIEELHRLKKSEKVEHDQTYRARSIGQLKKYTVLDFIKEDAISSYEDNSNIYGDVNKRFLDKISQMLQQHDSIGVRILDYGCGMGKLSVYLALKGYRNIYGFDLSEKGVEFGINLAKINEVGDRVILQQMDAESLEYPDDFFDVVIGKAVLHHTIKYKKSAGELKRVLKPGGVAIFKENIGNNPLFKIARFITMDIMGRHGDVNITSNMFYDYAKGFSSIEIEAYHFLYMLKRLIWKPGKQARWKKKILRKLKELDDLTVHRSQYLSEKFCGEAIFTLVL